MVRLENKHGVAVYVTPGEVRTISPHKDEGVTVIHTGDSFFNVRGTPDEVHAKLFPEKASEVFVDWKAIADDLAVRHFRQSEMADCYRPLIEFHTRKALGREAP